MSLAVLGRDVADVPFLTDERGAARDEGHLQMVDLRSQDLLCVNLSQTFHRPLAVMPAHLWLGAITRNTVHGPYFRANFGVDAYGVAPFVQSVGPWLLSPRPDILAQVHKLEASLLQKSRLHTAAPLTGPVIGLQMRLGMKLDVGVLSDRPPAGSGPEYARCAYSFIPRALRNRPSGWIIAADSSDAKRDVMMLLAQTEGPIVAASSEMLLRKSEATPAGPEAGEQGLAIPATYFASGKSLAPPVGLLPRLDLDERLAALGFAVAEFASGARALVLAQAPSMSSVDGMLAAVLEMWVLGCAALLVVSENSTFWVPAVSFMARQRRAWWRRWAGAQGGEGGAQAARSSASGLLSDHASCARDGGPHCQSKHAPAVEGLSTSVLGGGKGVEGGGVEGEAASQPPLPVDVMVFTRGQRCYPLGTSEPVSDTAHRSRRQTRSKCYDDAMLDPSITWLPPV